MVQVGHQLQVLLAGQQVVHRRELAGDADRRAHAVRVVGDVVAGHLQLAGVGGNSVERIRTIVVLPAPFGPSSAKIVPSATVRSTPSSTTVSPNDFRTPVTTTAG